MGVRGSPHRYEFEQVLRKGRGKSDQFSIPNSQFPSEKTVETEPFPRMRIENWELRIGQISSPLFSFLVQKDALFQPRWDIFLGHIADVLADERFNFQFETVLQHQVDFFLPRGLLGKPRVLRDLLG